jgi:hypothetical protein
MTGIPSSAGSGGDCGARQKTESLYSIDELCITFGSSAPLKDLLTKFGFTPGKVMESVKAQIARSKRR